MMNSPSWAAVHKLEAENKQLRSDLNIMINAANGNHVRQGMLCNADGFIIKMKSPDVPKSEVTK